MFGLCICKESTIDEVFDMLDEARESVKEATDALEESMRRNTNYHSIICEVMRRPENQTPEIQTVLTEILCRGFEGLSKEQWDQRQEKIRKFFEEGETLDFDDL